MDNTNENINEDKDLNKNNKDNTDEYDRGYLLS